MRLGFFVHMVDPDDTIRGFICGWIRALAQEVDELVVISHQSSITEMGFLGQNIRICNIGKEKGLSKWGQSRAFFKIMKKEIWGGAGGCHFDSYESKIYFGLCPIHKNSENSALYLVCP